MLMDPSFEANTLKILDKHEGTSLEALGNTGSFKLFPTTMKQEIKEELEKANCVFCNNVESHRCKNRIYSYSVCEKYCKTTPIFWGNFTLEQARWFLKGEEKDDNWSWDEQKVEVKDTELYTKKIEIHCKSPKYFFNITKAEKCHSGDLESNCIFGNIKCSGTGKWILEPIKAKCTQPENEEECQEISGYFRNGKCHGRPKTDEECKESGQGDLYDGSSHCQKADGNMIISSS